MSRLVLVLTSCLIELVLEALSRVVTAYLCPILRLRISGAIPLLPLYMLTVFTETVLALFFIYLYYSFLLRVLVLKIIIGRKGGGDNLVSVKE